VEAYGALLAGHARRRNVAAALGALQAFWAAGGQPDGAMFDTLVDLCVRTGEFRRAMQVGRQPAALPSPRCRMGLPSVESLALDEG
jgi:hypothetical protein